MRHQCLGNRSGARFVALHLDDRFPRCGGRPKPTGIATENAMKRAVFVLVIAGVSGLAGSARSDPSFNVPPATSAPRTAAPAPAPATTAPSVIPPAPAPRAAVPTTPPNAPATSATSPPPAPATEEGQRYAFHRVGDKFVRLDTRTGQVAECGWAASAWSCQAAADERTALDSEIARLQQENAALKKSLLARGVELPGGIVAGAPSQPPPVPPATVPDATPPKDPKGPQEADLNGAIAYVKHVWRRLVDLMVDLQREIQRKS
jgi:hypothetical protein